MDLKEQLQRVTEELIDAKRLYFEAQKRFDEVYNAVAKGSHLHQSEIRKLEKNNKKQGLRKFDRIEMILNEEPIRDHHVEEMAEKAKTTLNTARVLLYKLRKQGKAQRGNGVGMWRKS